MTTLSFPVERFINVYHLDNCEQTNAAIIDVIKQEGGTNSNITNVKGYTTNYHLEMPHNDEPYAQFFNFLNRSFYNSMTHLIQRNALSFNNISMYYMITDIWGSIYKHGEYCISHVHEPQQLSWCYYLQVPEGSADIVFDNIDYAITPKAGDLIMFPGWMSHSVPENKSQDERIILAGNLEISCYSNNLT